MNIIIHSLKNLKKCFLLLSNEYTQSESPKIFPDSDSATVLYSNELELGSQVENIPYFPISSLVFIVDELNQIPQGRPMLQFD